MTNPNQPPWMPPQAAPGTAPAWGAPQAPAQPAPWGQPAPAAQPAPWGQPAPAAQPAPHPQQPAWGAPSAPAQPWAPPQAPPAAQPAPWGQPAPAAQPAPWGAPPAPAFGNPFDKVATAKAMASGPPFCPTGFDVIVRVDETKHHIGANPQSKTIGHLFVICVFTIVHSNNALAQVNQQYSQSIDMNGYGAGDVKNLITALYGKTPGDAQAEAELAAQGAYSPAKIQEMLMTNPHRGKFLALKTQMNGRGTFTHHHWSQPPR